MVRAGTLNLANGDEVVKDTAGNEVLIPNGNAKLEHFVFMSLLYHDIRILSMRNPLNLPKNLVNLMGKGELYTF